MPLTLGVDPGLTGAMALLSTDGTCELVADLPIIADGKLRWIDGAALQSTLLDALRGRQCRAVVERVSADKARLLFPSADLRLAKHDGRAEALLLAHWAQQ